MQQSQKDYVISLLNNYSSVSRNHCLEQRITRLGAIINDLNNEGWNIVGGYVKSKRGKDFVYEVISSPYKRILYKVGDGREVVIFSK